MNTAEYDNVANGGERKPDYVLRREAKAEIMAEPLANAGSVDPADDLFEGKEPIYILGHERLHHRAIIIAAANGQKEIDIARNLGLHINTVRNTLCQPWARKRVIEFQKAVGRDDVEQKLQGICLDAIRTLDEIRKDDKARPSDRIAASTYLLNRYLGQPTQSMRVAHSKDVEAMSDEELQQVIEKERGACEATFGPAKVA